MVGSDIGGTFTDVIGLANDGCVSIDKVPSTPGDFSEALLEGTIQVARNLDCEPGAIAHMRHACTVATNAILEGRGAKVALITTKGFRDVLDLRRIRMPRLYDPLYHKPAPLVPRRRRFEIDERVAHNGEVLQPLRDAEIDRVIDLIGEAGVEAIAVCLLHSYANEAHERRLGTAIARRFPEVYCSLSVDVLPEMREYERTSTTVVNSYVGPVVADYLESTVRRFASVGVAAGFELMQSSGGTAPLSEVRRLPAQIIECGPAAGVVGVQKLGDAIGEKNIIVFDMGGTTAKASLIEDGRFFVSETFEVGSELSATSAMGGGAGYSVKLPVIDIAEVGAGGGSLVSIDAAGGVVVGPRSAGADPGPACYGRGNEQATVTDANVALGYIDPSNFAGGSIAIYPELAVRAIRDTLAIRMGSTMEEAAFGIRSIANAHMARAIKAVSTYKGRDPRDFIMVACGGNGGIHGPDLAVSLGVGTVLVPPAAGVFSALGLLCANVEVMAAVPLNIMLDTADWLDVAGRLNDARGLHGARLGSTSVNNAELSFLMRYSGQAFELEVPIEPAMLIANDVSALVRRVFEAVYRQTYGYCAAETQHVELVSARLRLSALASRSMSELLKALPRGEEHRSSRKCYFGARHGFRDTLVLSRAAVPIDEAITGPAIIAEAEGTTVVPPGATVQRDRHNILRVRLPLREHP
nr:hydantoinase/oxoprolinase family protein [Mesorhizobium silamurunense]